jgi:hypothetical protein
VFMTQIRMDLDHLAGSKSALSAQYPFYFFL